MEKKAMKNGFLMAVAFLGLSYTQTGNGATPMADLFAPTNMTHPDPAGEHDFAHSSVPGCEGWTG